MISILTMLLVLVGSISYIMNFTLLFYAGAIAILIELLLTILLNPNRVYFFLISLFSFAIGIIYIKIVDKEIVLGLSIGLYLEYYITILSLFKPLFKKKIR